MVKLNNGQNSIQYKLAAAPHLCLGTLIWAMNYAKMTTQIHGPSHSTKACAEPHRGMPTPQNPPTPTHRTHKSPPHTNTHTHTKKNNNNNNFYSGCCCCCCCYYFFYIFHKHATMVCIHTTIAQRMWFAFLWRLVSKMYEKPNGNRNYFVQKHSRTLGKACRFSLEARDNEKTHQKCPGNYSKTKYISGVEEWQCVLAVSHAFYSILWLLLKCFS